MTIQFCDVSHYDRDAGRQIPNGDQIVIAKSTHGTRFVDSAYTYHRDVAKARGIYFTSYHWLNHGNGAGQAQYCWQQVGRVPVMVDAEDMPNNTGYNGVLAVGDIVNFVVELRRLGGVSNLVYLPHWYWADHMGSPDLTPLRTLGVGLVSSNYTAYSDTGPGWNGYGGMTPVQWQFTSTPMDRNAYRGTVADYIALTSGGTVQIMSTDWSGLGAPKNMPYSADVASVDVHAVLRTGDRTGWSDTDGKGWWISKRVEQLVADVAAIKAAVAALTDAVNSGGGSVDVAAVKADIDEAAADIKATVKQGLSGLTLHAQ